MAIRNMRYDGDDILGKKSKPVEEITDKVLSLLDDMAETMYDKNGVGLAAPQVGVLRKVVVMDIGDGLIELINPEIIEKEGAQENTEACLSIPGMCATVIRPEYVKVKALDRNGKEFTIDGEGLFAICVCHETDHLEGILYKEVALPDTFRENTPPPDDDNDYYDE